MKTMFPKAAHDDGPDALEMAVLLVKSPKYTAVEVKTLFDDVKYCGSSRNPKRIISYGGVPITGH
jgi:hypothetical protein